MERHLYYVSDFFLSLPPCGTLRFNKYNPIEENLNIPEDHGAAIVKIARVELLLSKPLGHSDLCK